MAPADLDGQSIDETTSLVAISGELDLTTTTELRRRVDAAFSSGRPRLVIDLTGLTHMDSSGLAELISCHQRAAGVQGGLALVVTSEPIRRTLELRGVNHIFTLAGSREDAVAALAGS